MLAPFLIRLAAAGLLLVAVARADVPVPAGVLDPKTPAEAWNVLSLVSANLDRLVFDGRLDEIPVQASLASPALRVLAKGPENAPAAVREKLGALGVRAGNAITSLAQAARAGDALVSAETFCAFRSILHTMGAEYVPADVAGQVFHCPMHPDFTTRDARIPCDKCGMTPVPRRIPHSFIYVAPGRPETVLTATAAPLRAGERADVRIRLRQRGGSGVGPKDLLVTHTQPIHLLIVDPSLIDYHHEHPVIVPGGELGEYAFSFTPRLRGPYRIFADLLPASTAVQEYAIADLPGEGAGEPVVARPSKFECKLDGLRFELDFDGGNGAALPAGRVLNLRVTITGADGQPMRQLEPVMNAFAHMVGFYADQQTVVHLHPLGGEVQDPAARGGPVMSFRLLAPKAGYLRLYCQVQAGGKMLFAPFDLNIAPAGDR